MLNAVNKQRVRPAEVTCDQKGHVNLPQKQSFRYSNKWHFLFSNLIGKVTLTVT